MAYSGYFVINLEHLPGCPEYIESISIPFQNCPGILTPDCVIVYSFGHIVPIKPVKVVRLKDGSPTHSVELIIEGSLIISTICEYLCDWRNAEELLNLINHILSEDFDLSGRRLNAGKEYTFYFP